MWVAELGGCWIVALERVLGFVVEVVDVVDLLDTVERRDIADPCGFLEAMEARFDSVHVPASVVEVDN